MLEFPGFIPSSGTILRIPTESGLIWLADARAAGVAALSGGRSRPRSGRRPTRHRVCHPQQPHRPRLRPRPARPQGVCRRARSNEVRARGPDRPDLRPAARRPVYPAGIRVKRSWAGMRRHALGVRAVWVDQTGCGPAHVLQPSLLNCEASSRVAPRGSSLDHGEREAGGRMRRRVCTHLGRKCHGTFKQSTKCVCPHADCS